MAQTFLDIPGLPLGLKNNNPGNLRPLGNGQKWNGELTPGDTAHGFSRFSDIAFGLRAMITDVTGDIVIDKKNTLQKLITSYAPPGTDSNNTAGYIARVAALTGLAPNQIIVPTKETIRSLIRAQMAVELGDNYAGMVSDSDIETAFSRLSTEAAGWLSKALENTGAANLTALLLAAGTAYLIANHKKH